jgi:hypothetical protein
MSGSSASRASSLGMKSEIVCRPAAWFFHLVGTGPSWNAVPTMRSPNPSASRISVDVDLMLTTRFGAVANVTRVSQFWITTGASAEGAVGEPLAAGWADAALQPASSRMAAAARAAGAAGRERWGRGMRSPEARRNGGASNQRLTTAEPLMSERRTRAMQPGGPDSIEPTDRAD